MRDRNRKLIFAAALRQAIKASGKSEKQLAAEIGVPYSTVRKWCCGVQIPYISRVTALVRQTGDPGIFEAYLQEGDIELAKRASGARRRLKQRRLEQTGAAEP